MIFGRARYRATRCICSTVEHDDAMCFQLDYGEGSMDGASSMGCNIGCTKCFGSVGFRASSWSRVADSHPVAFRVRPVRINLRLAQTPDTLRIPRVTDFFQYFRICIYETHGTKNYSDGFVSLSDNNVSVVPKFSPSNNVRGGGSFPVGKPMHVDRNALLLDMFCFFYGRVL